MNDIERFPVAPVISDRTYIVIIIFTGAPELHVARRAELLRCNGTSKRVFTVLSKHHAVEMVGE